MRDWLTRLHIHNDTWTQCDEGDESSLSYDNHTSTTAYLTLLPSSLSLSVMTDIESNSARAVHRR